MTQQQVRQRFTTRMWPISPDCPAQTHNTFKAATGYGGVTKCSCPHSSELLEVRRKRKRERYHLTNSVNIADPTQQRRPKSENSATLALRTHLVPPMDFPRGACTTLAGLKVMDGYQATPNTRPAIDAARALCKGCSSLAACADWVRRAERPAGAWQGMIGGMTRIERFHINGEHNS